MRGPLIARVPVEDDTDREALLVALDAAVRVPVNCDGGDSSALNLAEVNIELNHRVAWESLLGLEVGTCALGIVEAHVVLKVKVGVAQNFFEGADGGHVPLIDNLGQRCFEKRGQEEARPRFEIHQFII